MFLNFSSFCLLGNWVYVSLPCYLETHLGYFVLGTFFSSTAILISFGEDGTSRCCMDVFEVRWFGDVVVNSGL